MSYYKKYLKYKYKYENILNGGDITDPILTTYTQTSLEKKILSKHPEFNDIKERPLEYRFLILNILRLSNQLYNLTEFNKIKQMILKIYILTPDKLDPITLKYFKQLHQTEFLQNRNKIISIKRRYPTFRYNFEFERLSNDRKYEFYLNYIRKLYNIEDDLMHLEYLYDKIIEEIEELTLYCKEFETKYNKLKLKLKIKGYYDKLEKILEEEKEHKKEYVYKKQLLTDKQKDLDYIYDDIEELLKKQELVIKTMESYYIYF